MIYDDSVSLSRFTYPNSGREVGQSGDLKVAIVELAAMPYSVKRPFVLHTQPR